MEEVLERLVVSVRIVCLFEEELLCNLLMAAKGLPMEGLVFGVLVRAVLPIIVVLAFSLVL
jgi:hypothetical protein